MAMILILGITATIVAMQILWCCPSDASQNGNLRLAIIQMAISADVEVNCQKMTQWIDKAAEDQARVVVFPEGALWVGPEDISKGSDCRNKLANLAREKNMYIIFGECLPGSKPKEEVQAARVFGPNGEEIFHYVKHYSVPSSPIPGVFQIDDIPAGAIICADRWLRTVEELPIQLGAKISFELSANFEAEWVPDLGWYWYIPRALRNNVWVVFANSAANVNCPGHGHSAVVSPDGTVVASLPDSREAMLICDINPQLATRREAVRRATHPTLQDFWKTGLRMYDGIIPDANVKISASGQSAVVTLAATTVTGDLREMTEAIATAKLQSADLLAFPSRACHPANLAEIQQLARQYRICLAVGIRPTEKTEAPYAAIIGGDGSIVTQVFALSNERTPQSKGHLRNLLFSLKGVPAIVVLENDILWTEIVELAAVHGVRILVHLNYTEDSSQHSRQRQLQVWATAASYQMFSVMADIQQAALWEDLNPRAERRAVIEGRALPDPPPVEILSPFSANLIRHTVKRDVIAASQRIPAGLNYFQDRVGLYPGLKAWLQLGQEYLFPFDSP